MHADGPARPAAEERSVPSDGRGLAEVTLIADLACPWCYIAVARLLRLRSASPFTLTWRPLLLNAQLPAAGVPRAAFLAGRPGGARHAALLEGRAVLAARAEGLDLRFERIVRQPSTLLGNALVLAAGRRGPELAYELSRAFFTEGLDLSAEPVLAHAAARFALSLDAARERTGAVMRSHQDSAGLGIDGVPITIFGREHMIGGTQPMECLEALLDLEAARVTAL